MFKNRIQFARVLAVLTMSMLSMSSWEAALAQDVVFTRSSRGTETPRKGTIVDWQGDTLTIEIGGREKSIKGPDIVRIQTAWSEQYQNLSLIHI